MCICIFVPGGSNEYVGPKMASQACIEYDMLEMEKLEEQDGKQMDPVESNRIW